MRIRQLVDKGFSLKKIAEMLGSDWEAAERQSKKRELGPYNFAEVSARLDHQAGIRNFVLLVAEKIDPVLAGLRADPRQALRDLHDKLFQQETVDAAIALVRQGCNPLLAYDGASWSLAPDFVVGQVLAGVGKKATGLLVVSIHSEVVTAFESLIDDLPANPSITPVSRVQRRLDAGTVEHQVHLVGNWDFEIGTDSQTAPQKCESA